MNNYAPATSAGGGGPISGGGGRGAMGGRSRRAKNRRYRQNRQNRSRLQFCCWNAEGLRPKKAEFQRWLSSEKIDVAAVQEVQLPANQPFTIPGYQTAVVTKRARGRRDDGPAKGGGLAIFVRDGLNFSVIDNSPLNPLDDTTEWCGVRIYLSTTSTNPSSTTHSLSSSSQHVDVYNVYRPPIRTSETDQRQDRFSMDNFPTNNRTVIAGDFNGHHSSWDSNYAEPDRTGALIADWVDANRWCVLNDPTSHTRTSYGPGPSTSPDVAMCHQDLATRCSWHIGTDLGSDHLPQVIRLTTNGARPRRIRKTRWAFHKADWTSFTNGCEEAFEALEREDLSRLSTDTLATRINSVIAEQSVRAIPRGARADPKPWRADPELETAIRDRRQARAELKENPSREAKERWKSAKQKAAEIEETARTKCFRDFASTELNKPTSLGRVSKILRKMEGKVQTTNPGQAINGDRGRLAVEDRCKAQTFVQTYAAVSKKTRVKKLDRKTKAELQQRHPDPCSCDGTRTEACQPFNLDELNHHLKKMRPKKAPGPDKICAEHLHHLGPAGKRVILHLINQSWLRGSVPRCWKIATIIPILKAGKPPAAASSYRPIALTSNLAKLAERMIGARLTHLTEQLNLVPAEQVGFRPGRAAEDNIGRLVQTVQDGWNKPPKSGRRAIEGKHADRFVLLAFDFARAYDRIDHRMLKLKLLRHGLPKCMVTWIHQFLSDRRARVEVNGTLSAERPFRAGLPQGSVLAPTLYTLWAADLITALQTIPGTSVYMYADDTATLSSGATIETAQKRAQQAADVMTSWAYRWKMVVAGHKTQALVLSQWAQDAKNLHLRVAGATITGDRSLKLLGVTFDRLLHFGEHCAAARRKVKPRIAQLRKLTGRTWGLREAQLRTIANGYVRGALEYCAAAWLPAASESHVETIDIELRAAARAITGCPGGTPRDALMAEAGMAPARVRRQVLAARLKAHAAALPEDDPLRITVDTRAPHRLKTTGWR